ncbi:WSC domain-containing protein [Xylariaceae sp. FL0016]|nr:WSC domain-containing protein [Xylariaceae sp. FL0016]
MVVSTDSILQSPTAPPSPIQTGIVPNCASWMQASPEGDDCARFASRANADSTALYQLNPFLGRNGEKCDMQLWANYWYCVATSGAPSPTNTATVITVTPSTPTSIAQAPKPTSAPTTIISIHTDTPNKPSPATSPSPSPSPTTPSLSGYAYTACHEDTGPRVLSSTMLGDDLATPERCTAFCASKRLPYAGVASGRECWCGAALKPGARKIDEAHCNMPCAGDKSEMCGGSAAIGVYRKSTGGKRGIEVREAGGSGDGYVSTTGSVVRQEQALRQEVVTKVVRMVKRGRFMRRHQY